MEDKQISMLDVLIEIHIGLDRQGPGSAEATRKALSFIDNINEVSQVADLACGTGGQTVVLAQNSAANIVGVDICPGFINVFNDNAKKLNIGDRVKGIVGSMENLIFGKEEFDLIWSEGAIDNIGFEKGLSNWRSFLKKGGHVAVTCPSWLMAQRPPEIEKFWVDAGSSLDSVEMNIEAMQRAGYSFVAAFALPEHCWTDNYFIPREAAGKSLLHKYGENRIVKDYLANDRVEVELYSKYKQYYGYVFYIGKKI